MNWEKPVMLNVANLANGKRRVWNGCWSASGLVVMGYALSFGPETAPAQLWPATVAILGLFAIWGVATKRLGMSKLFPVYLIAIIWMLAHRSLALGAWALFGLALLLPLQLLWALPQYFAGAAECPLEFIRLGETAWRVRARRNLRLAACRLRQAPPELGLLGWIATALALAALVLVFIFWVSFAFSLGLFGLSDGDARMYSFMAAGFAVPILAAVLRHWWPSASSLRSVDSRLPVVLLRPFEDDALEVRRELKMSLLKGFYLPANSSRAFESVMASAADRFGPAVTIGDPAHKLPPLGAARQYVPADRWQGQIEGLSREAQCILLVLGRSEGIRWEVARILQSGFLSKTVIVVPPVDDDELALRWHALIELSSGVPQLGWCSKTAPKGLLAALVSDTGAPIAFCGERREFHYREALRLAVGLVGIRDGCSAGALRRERRGVFVRLAANFALARFYVATGAVSKARSSLDRFDAVAQEVPAFRGRRLSLKDCHRAAPGAVAMEKLVHSGLNAALFGRLVLQNGLCPLWELMEPFDLPTSDAGNWRVRNTFKFYFPESADAAALDQPLAAALSGACAYCQQIDQPAALRPQDGTAHVICRHCIELIDALLENGSCPTPARTGSGRCSFCGHESSGLLLCGNGAGVWICLSCARAPYLGDRPASSFPRCRRFGMLDLVRSLQDRNPWRRCWGLHRILETPRFLKVKVVRTLVLDLSGDESPDVRSAASMVLGGGSR